MSHPLPKGKLLLIDDRVLVKKFDDSLDLHSLRFLLMHLEHNS